MRTIKPPPLYRVVIVQLASLALISLLMLLEGWVGFYSTAMGGMIHVVSQAWFARMAYRHQGARQAPRILHSMYLGQAGKLLITSVLFALVFVFVQPLNVVALFLGYGIMVVVYLYAAARVISPIKNKSD